jgi:hypothetical protein
MSLRNRLVCDHAPTHRSDGLVSRGPWQFITMTLSLPSWNRSYYAAPAKKFIF